jgi:hypothetical protein
MATASRVESRRTRNHLPSTRQKSGLLPGETRHLQVRKRLCRFSTLLPSPSFNRNRAKIHSRVKHPKVMILKLPSLPTPPLRPRKALTYQTLRMMKRIHGLGIIDSSSKHLNLLMYPTRLVDHFPMHIMRKFCCLESGMQSVSLLTS